jgi:CubicO group peptidase (beta-lactamase class C family)
MMCVVSTTMQKIRLQTWLAIGVIGIGVLLVAIPGMWVYMSATATPLHPNPQDVPTATKPAPSSALTNAVEAARSIVRAELVGQNLPGVSVAVGIGSDLVWGEGFGWADLENRVAVTPSTRFRIGTASMALTSAGVGLLLEQGRLTLDETIQTHVPAFPSHQWPVTLRQVMAHTAGIRTDSGDEGPLLAARCDDVREAVEQIADYPLLFEPGTTFRRSSYGWILVSAAVEAAADEPFHTFMRRHVFEPLGMDDTRPDAIEPIANRAVPYFPRFAADPRYGPDLMRPLDYSCYAGASAFLSTPSDLVRFAQGIAIGTFLQPTTVGQLQTSARLPTREETGYGLGWDIKIATLHGQPARVVGHDGEVLGGPVASMLMFPEHGIVVSVISNTSYADTFALAVKIAEVFVGA